MQSKMQDRRHIEIIFIFCMLHVKSYDAIQAKSIPYSCLLRNIIMKYKIKKKLFYFYMYYFSNTEPVNPYFRVHIRDSKATR